MRAIWPQLIHKRNSNNNTMRSCSIVCDDGLINSGGTFGILFNSTAAKLSYNGYHQIDTVQHNRLQQCSTQELLLTRNLYLILFRILYRGIGLYRRISSQANFPLLFIMKPDYRYCGLFDVFVFFISIMPRKMKLPAPFVC